MSNLISNENNEERPQNRNLAGATVNAPGAKLAQSFTRFVKNCFSQKMLLIILPFIFVALHWLSVRTYATFCVPEGLFGMLTSIMTTSSPICTFTFQAMEYTAMLYAHSWIVLGFTAFMLLKNFMESFCSDSALKFSGECSWELSKKHRLVQQLLQHKQQHESM